MMWGVYDDWSWWGWLLMSLSMVVFWGLVAWVVVSLTRRGREPAAGGPDAEEVLRRRFADGELDEDEYRSRLQTLRGGRPVGPAG